MTNSAAVQWWFRVQCKRTLQHHCLSMLGAAQVVYVPVERTSRPQPAAMGLWHTVHLAL